MRTDHYRKTRRFLLPLFGVLLLACCLLPLTAGAKENVSGDLKSAAPSGYELPQPAESVVRTYASGTYDTASNYTAVLADGVLTVSGTGETESFSDTSYIPWYEDRYSITSIVVEEGITSLGEAFFYGCGNVTSVTLPQSLTRIGTAAFANCYALEEITLPDALRSIGDYAFQQTSLCTLALPASVTELGSYIAYGCSSLEAYAVADGNPAYTSVDGVLMSADRTTLIAYPIGNSWNVYEIPDGVTVLADGAFQHASLLCQVSFASSVTTLGDWVFADAGLTSAEVPATVTQVGEGTFDECGRLETLDFEAKVDTARYRLCYQCSSLREAVLSDTITTLENQAFYGCSSLSDVTLPANLVVCGSGGGTFWQCTSLERITLPDTVEEIGLSCFYECTSLKEVTRPSKIRSIGAYAFYGCSALTGSWELPSTIEHVYQDAFAGSGMRIVVPDGMEELADGSYDYAMSLKLSGTYDYDSAYEVLDLLNEQRAGEGLVPLTMDGELLDAAMQRAAECAVSFSHTRPSDLTCFTASDRMYAENIAAGQVSAAEVMADWMNSSGHRANILSSSYQSVGIGCFVHEGECYWVQCFGTVPADEPARKGKAQGTAVVQALTRNVTLQAASSALTVTVGGTATASVRIRMADTYGTPVADGDSFAWSTANAAVATCTAGTVKGVAAGTTTVTAQIRGKSVAFSVTVQNQAAAGTSVTQTTEAKTQTVKVPTVKKVKNFKATPGKHKLVLKWSKVSGAAGYQIQIDTTKKFKNPTSFKAGSSATKKTLKKYGGKRLVSGKKYYVRIRAYKTYTNEKGKTVKVYGSWRTVKKKTT